MDIKWLGIILAATIGILLVSWWGTSDAPQGPSSLPLIEKEEILNEMICRPQWLEQTHADLKRHEGFRPYAYPDPLSPLGKKHGSKFGYKPARNVLASIGANEKDGAPWTVGYGFTGKNITPDTQMSEDDASDKLYDEIVAHVKGLDKLTPNWLQFPVFVQSVLANLIFNMGETGLSKFTNTLNMINNGNYVGASANLVKSLWYKQVGGRAVELVARLATGDISDKHKVTPNS